ncbi:hypothetical protein [Fusobacterium pseudoperiodonticum]|uniref:hypothetical protein n=1 Tax=Fusobacterium pseudoperiodonticum TaxID=2663009 RepID=UPI0028E5D206|nr:hypothetical protein [Fusobacterium pseudoperiodonticum]
MRKLKNYKKQNKELKNKIEILESKLKTNKFSYNVHFYTLLVISILAIVLSFFLIINIGG